MSTCRFLGCASAVAAAGTVLALTTAGVASAHVTAHSDSTAQGSYAKITFRVPNEEAHATTTKLVVKLPTGSPLASVSYQPTPGWNAQATTTTLPEPVHQNDETVSRAVTRIVWTAQPGGGIAPGQFQEFAISAGPLPDNTSTLTLPATQYYDDGTVVHWNQRQAGDQEPEHPAPTITLTAAGSGAHGAEAAAATAPSSPETSAALSSGVDSTARWLGGAGLVAGALGLGVAAGALLAGRARSRS